MRYGIDTLTRDVMARLGEVPRPQSSQSDIPWPQDVIALKVRSLLPEAGSRLILEPPQPPQLPNSPTSQLPNSTTSQLPTSTTRQMPCGLYAAEVSLPDDFLRLGSVKMGEWRYAVTDAAVPGGSGWNRQWSAEPGIAGCPACPRAYLDRTAAGTVLRLMGSVSEEDVLEWLTVWRIPAPDAEGCFDFPGVLYPVLVSTITATLSNDPE